MRPGGMAGVPINGVASCHPILYSVNFMNYVYGDDV